MIFKNIKKGMILNMGSFQKNRDDFFEKSGRFNIYIVIEKTQNSCMIEEIYADIYEDDFKLQIFKFNLSEDEYNSKGDYFRSKLVNNKFWANIWNDKS